MGPREELLEGVVKMAPELPCLRDFQYKSHMIPIHTHTAAKRDCPPQTSKKRYTISLSTTKIHKYLLHCFSTQHEWLHSRVVPCNAKAIDGVKRDWHGWR
jgi:hypothetical protein